MPRLGGWFDPRPPTGALRPVLLTLGGDATAALTPPCGTTSGAQLKWEGWDMGSKLRLATPLLAVVALMLIGATASIAANGNGNGKGNGQSQGGNGGQGGYGGQGAQGGQGGNGGSADQDGNGGNGGQGGNGREGGSGGGSTPVTICHKPDGDATTLVVDD